MANTDSELTRLVGKLAAMLEFLARWDCDSPQLNGPPADADGWGDVATLERIAEDYGYTLAEWLEIAPTNVSRFLTVSPAEIVETLRRPLGHDYEPRHDGWVILDTGGGPHIEIVVEGSGMAATVRGYWGGASAVAHLTDATAEALELELEPCCWSVDR